MKRVVSLSLGSSKRNKSVKAEILGEEYLIERIGFDGDMRKWLDAFSELDGKVDVFGLGGIDLYLYAGKRKYTLRDAEKVLKRVKKTPVVDGSGLKNTLERRVINYFSENEEGFSFKGKRVLMPSALDRFGMAESLISKGADILYGDAVFTLGLPLPIRNIKHLYLLGHILLPVVRHLPFKILYPTGSKQESSVNRYEKYYNWAEIIAGDFHFIRRYIPRDISGKVIITNTVTEEDIEFIKKAGAAILVTTTPELDGRSFGTNVIEGVIVAATGKWPDELSTDDYNLMLDKIGFRPRIIRF